MWWRFSYKPTAYTDDWEDQPGQGPLYQWGLGVAVAVVMMGWGVYAMVTRHVQIGGEQPMSLRGWNAVAVGVAGVSAGLFVHCHYFWGNIYNQAWFAVIGKIVAAGGFIAGIGIVVVRSGLFAIN